MTEDAGLTEVHSFILKRGGGSRQLAMDFGRLLREAIESVIDGPRSGRWSIGELDKNEKTYIGTRVELLTRSYLGVPKGILDLQINDHPVDVKFSLTSSWMIPREAIGHLCLLISTDEQNGQFSVGLARARDESLTKGANQDMKRQFSAASKREITWLVDRGVLPFNFLYQLAPRVRSQILSHESGQQRVNELLRLVQGIVIPRDAIEVVARQKDPMKRIRSNGGARDKLWLEGIMIFSGKYDREAVRQLGLPNLTADDFISVSTRSALALGCNEIVDQYRLSVLADKKLPEAE